MTQERPKAKKICIIGLGYVGLPLAVEFAKYRPVIGFDINADRIAELSQGVDRTKELDRQDLKQAKQLRLTSDIAEIAEATTYIVTVPTPIDNTRRPDLRPLLSASRAVGQVLKPGDTVIYESTVFPGATEEECVPLLEDTSGLVLNRDFGVGYSPERINPGDKTRRLPDIVKITSGSTPETAAKVDALYAEIVTAGTYKAESIRVAEAAKVIENSQRDINIALINELAMIFNRMGIDTEAVLRAAGTKWNFLKFRPGLVGGHCIGVDPYYLTHKAQQLGYHPEILLSGRRLNDGMGAYVAQQMIKAMLKRRLHVVDARVLVMGLTFKENCPDLRNTRVVDVIEGLRDFGVAVDIYDPCADPAEAQTEYGLELTSKPGLGVYDGIIVAVAHDEFTAMGAEGIRAFGKDDTLLYDLKYVLSADQADLRL
ncbi:Vi polysaccharide biosynthesis UDP-N-acetylglucosamine C-6 dehydrogenase TviB [Phaeobacter sp. B1627]|uniref:Vi polysaccharide biosynthesis UDP-N-acetylglucosamine C-6 dehydrogenase TviB n=1 Tax=Phaeobacter sp. B1627 TaxID=2583809 RepID=UPI00111ADAAD|nr:Vi polysaccharide biosynthesis UDP-N-acetylglucosamine C-6 dehydrogenase TviB [Phaeobacter sp. B1627]TNJ45918.1 Vi polysaccharide biosynthesis UDP-N-acetylglucosamine C-6 dehydrogenase TviB [Phaeobacter sp. B1627]